jgi:hypothetical protein
MFEGRSPQRFKLVTKKVLKHVRIMDAGPCTFLMKWVAGFAKSDFGTPYRSFPCAS